MIDLKISVDTSQASALLGDKLPKALPYVKAAMLTRLATAGREAVQKQMAVDFDKPTTFTIRGVWFKAATKSSPAAQVYVPDSQPGTGRGAREYLRPGVVQPGARRQKRTEFLLSRMGFLPGGWVTTPGSSTGKLGMIDGNGNLKGRIYAQVINVLQIKRVESKTARGVSMASQKRAQKMGVQAEWFAVAPGKNSMARNGGWLPPGVYRRTGKAGEKLQQILKFVQRAAYAPRLEFDGTVRESVGGNVQPAWDAALQSVAARFLTRR